MLIFLGLILVVYFGAKLLIWAVKAFEFFEELSGQKKHHHYK